MDVVDEKGSAPVDNSVQIPTPAVSALSASLCDSGSPVSCFSALECDVQKL
jgi:hypothetical protein